METNELKDDRNTHLKHKKGELDAIMKETEKEENGLIKNQVSTSQKLMNHF